MVRYGRTNIAAARAVRAVRSCRPRPPGARILTGRSGHNDHIDYCSLGRGGGHGGRGPRGGFADAGYDLEHPGLPAGAVRSGRREPPLGDEAGREPVQQHHSGADPAPLRVCRLPLGVTEWAAGRGGGQTKRSSRHHWHRAMTVTQ